MLLASEQELLREGLAALCERSGRHEVVGQCGDGSAAVQVASARQPDVCLLDLGLRSLHAFELISRLRRAAPNTRTVIVAERADARCARGILHAGASGVLLTSGPLQSLFDAISLAAEGGIYLPPGLPAEGVLAEADAGDPLSALSEREYQVFRLLVEGVRPKEIANRLDLSPKTVDSHRKNLMRKLDIHDLPTLVRFAVSRTGAR